MAIWVVGSFADLYFKDDVSYVVFFKVCTLDLLPSKQTGKGRRKKGRTIGAIVRLVWGSYEN